LTSDKILSESSDIPENAVVVGLNYITQFNNDFLSGFNLHGISSGEILEFTFIDKLDKEINLRICKR
jgi:hypothetical protein